MYFNISDNSVFFVSRSMVIIVNVYCMTLCFCSLPCPRLDQELDFILSQQKELEDLLSPLEGSVKEQSGTIYMQNADEERERT